MAVLVLNRKKILHLLVSVLYYILFEKKSIYDTKNLVQINIFNDQ